MQVPTQDVFDSPVYRVCVNEFWWSCVNGAIANLLYRSAWEGTDDEIDRAISSISKILNVRATHSDCEDTVQYPQHATLWHDEATVLTGGGLVRVSPADAPFSIADSFYNVGAYQSSAANGDSFEQRLVLDAGNYTFYALGLQNNVHGKVDWSLDGTIFASGQDWYHASVQANIIKTASLTVATGGQHILTGVMNGKNASSGAYALPLTKYWFEYVP